MDDISVEKQALQPTLEGERKPVAIWKKLAIAGTALLVVSAVTVSLGVGMTCHKSNDSHNLGFANDFNEDSGWQLIEVPNDDLEDNLLVDSDDDFEDNLWDDESDDDIFDDSDADLDLRSTDYKWPKLWQPKPKTTWQIVLQNNIVPPSAADPLTPKVSVYDLDLFDNPKSTIKKLQNRGIKVICYFSAGSWESYRADADEFPKKDLGKTLDGWPDEKWVNVSSPAVRAIMKKRIQVAANKGCDAIDPDNMDGYENDNGLGLTQADAVSYLKFLARTAAAHGMSTGLKNAGDIIGRVLPWVAFSVNEQCVKYSECSTFAPFIKAGKAVFHIEYPSGIPNVSEATRKKMCNGDGVAGLSTVMKRMNLNGWVEYCNGKKFKTEVEGDS